MPKIKNQKDFGKHCHHCNYWMARRALRKELQCDQCTKKITRRKFNDGPAIFDRCIECDAIILVCLIISENLKFYNFVFEIFNYCECCGVETPRGRRITKARQLKEAFLKPQLRVTTFSCSQTSDGNVPVTMDSECDSHKGDSESTESTPFADWNVSAEDLCQILAQEEDITNDSVRDKEETLSGSTMADDGQNKEETRSESPTADDGET